MKKINKILLKNILNAMKDNSNITEIEIANRYFYSERTIRRYIKILKNNEYIKMTGNGRRRKWIVLKEKV